MTRTYPRSRTPRFSGFKNAVNFLNNAAAARLPADSTEISYNIEINTNVNSYIFLSIHAFTYKYMHTYIFRNGSRILINFKDQVDKAFSPVFAAIPPIIQNTFSVALNNITMSWS